MDELQEARNHAGSEEAFGNQKWVVGVPLLPRVVRIDSNGLFSFDDDPSCDPQHDPPDEAEVGENVGQIPHVTNVLPESHLVDLFHLLPHDGKDPYDDKAFDWRWK